MPVILTQHYSPSDRIYQDAEYSLYHYPKQYFSRIRPGDRFICPSSPAWGHGLWHGTLAPLVLGLTIGAYAGKFDARRLLTALGA